MHLQEAHIIDYLHSEFPEHIGDDAAVLALSEQQNYLLSKDLLIQDVHFNLKYTDPLSLAHKTLHVNLSDIAAMGGTPAFVLLGIAIPTAYTEELPHFLRAFSECCKACKILLIGGDTSYSTTQLMFSVTVIGQIDKPYLKYRHTAKATDQIYLAGKLGYAHVGLQALETEQDVLELFKTHFLKPTACLKEGAWLGKQTGVHALMDVSDGLYIDLKRLCAASQVAAEIHLDKLPKPDDFLAACAALKLDPQTTQLTGGEDYGLLMTLDKKKAADICEKFLHQFGYPLTPIGQIQAGQDISFIKNGKKIHLDLKPFSHFDEL